MTCAEMAAEFEADARARKTLLEFSGRQESGAAAVGMMLGAVGGGLGTSVRLQERADAYAHRREALAEEGARRCVPPDDAGAGAQ